MSTTADALRDYQRWAERLAEARLGAHKARHHLERCHEAEHEAMRGIRDAVERMGGHDPLGISRSAQAKAAPVRDQVLAALPGTRQDVATRVGMRAEAVSRVLNQAHGLGLVRRMPGHVWEAVA